MGVVVQSLPVASVVVPAHNEERLIDRCLTSLSDQPGVQDIQIIVVANGCSDGTADRARCFGQRLPRLTVIEVPEASKVGALNAGDAIAESAVRIYLDADIELGPASLRALVDALSGPEAVCASPRVEFDLESASGLVAAFYRAFRGLPYVRDSLIGLGLYGLSASGRRRFDKFPDVVADDLFVQQLFEPTDRLTTGGTFTVSVPRVLRDLVRVRTRVAQGNAELASRSDRPTAGLASSTKTTSGALAAMAIRRPSLAVPVIVYVLVTLVARWRAPHVGPSWPRDESSRAGAPRGRARIDGVEFDALSHDEAVDRVMSDLGVGVGGLILTPNADILRQIRRRPELAELAGLAQLVVADGMPIVWASWLQGSPLPERVTGADLVWSLSAAASRRGRRVFLLGAASGVGDRASAALRLRHPELEIAGVVSPPLGFDRDSAALAKLVHVVRSAQPDIVFVALGFPRQEQVALALREAMPATYFLGCGGALDMAAGDVARANGVVQRLGAEWVTRLIQEPRRLSRRYLVDGVPYVTGLLSRATLRRLGWHS